MIAKTNSLNSALIAARGISKRFGVVQALREVSLDFYSSEILALVGENGAGKSTLLRILEGEYQPDAGSLQIDGNPVTISSARSAHALGIRVVHQEPEIIPELSVAENVFIGDYTSKRGLIDWNDLERRTLGLLREFGLEGMLEPRKSARELGPAQRQLIEIMRALRPGLRLLALDEPTSSLTEQESARLFTLLARLRKGGVGIIYISHRLREVVALADRIAVLRDGQLIGVRDGRGVTETEMIGMMVGRAVGTLFNHKKQTQSETVLEARHLTTRKVTDVSFRLQRGEILGVAGLVGAGRSELAKGVFGFDRLISGEVIVSGKTLRLRSPADAILAGMGLVPEDRKHEALLLLQSVRLNVSLCVPEKISQGSFIVGALERALVAPLVKQMRVKTPSLEQSIAKLSGGNQQKVVFARWLARQPTILILDEPTRGIDVGAKAEIYRLIEDLAASGIGIILISSEMPEILGLTDRILVMSGGRIAGELETSAASEERVLELAMTHHLNRSVQSAKELHA